MDEDMRRALKHGDATVIQRIYEESFAYCSTVVMRNNGTLTDARDMFQEAILVLYQNCRKRDYQFKCSSKTYLYSVMRNLWMKELRKRYSRGSVDLEIVEHKYIILDEEETKVKMEDEHRFESISVALEQIAIECRKILMDFYYKQVSLTDLAQELGYTYKFIKVKKNRCMKKLKELINDQNEDG